MSDRLTAAQIAEIEARAMAATPGPWRWELNLKHKNVSLCGDNPRSGFGAYDLTVLDFTRWGMSSAQPRFLGAGHLLAGANTLGKVVDGREHHAEWFQTIDHPDAAFIAHARTDIPALVRDLRAAREALETVRSGLRNLPASATAVQIDEVARAALPEETPNG